MAMLFRPIQFLLVRAVTSLSPKNEVHIRHSVAVPGLVPAAVIDLLYLDRLVGLLYGVPVLPEARWIIHIDRDELNSWDPVWTRVLQNLKHPLAALPGGDLPVVIEKRGSTRRFPSQETIELDAGEGSREMQIRTDSLSYDAALREHYQPGLWHATRGLRPKGVTKPILDLFARRLFGYATIRDEPYAQFTMIQRLLEGHDLLGLAPVGAGKSLVYQLPAFLLPGQALVLSPLVSLMRDQLDNLRRFGRQAVSALGGSQPKEERQEIQEAFVRGYSALLYVSPERLQIAAFRSALRPQLDKLDIRILAVDEAHCVSEWGHDFRPAYLNVARFAARLRRSGSGAALVALSGTASRPVLSDVRETLRLQRSDTVAEQYMDRPNLSFSVHPVSAYEEKLAKTVRVLSESVGKALALPHPLLKDTGQPVVQGVVFCKYADAHRPKTVNDSVGTVVQGLREEAADPERVTYFCSESVATCGCGSLHCVVAGRAGLRCNSCGQTFRKGEASRRRQEGPRKIQDDFKNGAYRIMVSTKAYGMGVDKPDIRFTIHNGATSSLEGFYQEAGRAGRDDHHSHCALVYYPPHKGCELDYFQGTLSREGHETDLPPCFKSTTRYAWQLVCPYVADGSACDYAQQVAFLTELYAPIEKRVERMADVTSRLLETPERKIWVKSPMGGGKQPELDLVYLRDLGVIQGYSCRYGRGSLRIHVQLSKKFNIPRLRRHLRIACERLQRVAHESGDLPADSTLRLNQVLRELSMLRAQSDDPSVLVQAVRLSSKHLVSEAQRDILRRQFRILRNLHRFATVNQCRKLYLAGMLEIQQSSASQECGFCDVCEPGLDFGNRERARLDPHRRRPADMLHDLNLLRSDRTLGELACHCVQVVAASGVERVVVLGYIDRLLEEDPDNVPALFVSAIVRLCSAQGAESEREEGWRSAALAARLLHQKAERKSLDVLYEALRQVDAARAFELLTRRGGCFDDPQGLEELCATAGRIWGETSAQATRFKRVVSIQRAMTTWDKKVGPVLRRFMKLARRGRDE